MTAAVQWIDPGAVGFVAGGVLIVCAVALVWLLLSGRRVDAERATEIASASGVARVPQPWHPSLGEPRPEPVTELFTLRVDEPDATVVMSRVPRQRAVRRG
ncbi:hypothetical protein [Micromonospora sp. NPDC005174]|uniref:hypothetical protein n=1 Tax=Micromonospora sp. NPDC005174 TaxID=3157018 RepID=UPI0033AB360D